MLSNLHATIEHTLYTHGGIPAGEVEISFEMPTQEWIESLTRPTINLFLFDIQENTELRQTSMPTTRSNGAAAQRMPPQRFDLRYLVSALSALAADEHLLIWRALATLLKYQHFSAELRDRPAAFLEMQRRTITELHSFVETLEVAPAVRAELGALLPEPQLAARACKEGEGPRPLDVWAALNLPPRLSMLYVVTVPLDLDIMVEAPLVLTRTLRTRQPAAEAGESWSVGGVVRDAAGQPQPDLVVSIKGRARKGSRTNGHGQYVLGNLRPGKLQLLVTHGRDVLKVARIEVPSDSYDIALD